MIECRIINLSAGSACLELPKYYDMPKKFEFIYGSSRKVCHLAWYRGLRLGISYADGYQTSWISSGLNRNATGVNWLSRKKTLFLRSDITPTRSNVCLWPKRTCISRHALISF